MTSAYDVIIVGLGAVGSATAYHLSRRGARVLGLEQFTPAHAQGSSHGQTRLIRELYFEHPLYVPLVQRAYELWEQLERDSGAQLQRRAGAIMIGKPAGSLVTGTLRSATENGLPAEVLPAAEVTRRFPALVPAADQVGVWDPRAGILAPEACLHAHLESSTRSGAELRFEEAVEAWSATGDAVSVKASTGTFHATRLLLAAGAWTRQLLPALDLPLLVERQAVLWFRPRANAKHFALGRLPVFVADDDPLLYGFPDLGNGVKLALHHGGETAEGPQQIRREIDERDVQAVRAASAALLPDAAGELLQGVTCLYTNTPDSHFLIDFHPDFGNVLIASPCSGHGFKFASVIGELLSDLLMQQQPRFDLSPFRLQRFDHNSS